MSIEKPDNERLDLYNRFKQSLKSGDDSAFYDADDLIIIIDQAVDLEDEYTEIEAIMRGYRFFPDNEELAARRAFLYYDLNLDEGVDNMRGQLAADSPMTRILNIRRLNDGNVDKNEVIGMLNEIAAKPGLLNDEEVIQLVDCASSSGCFDWLKANEKKLRTKTDYLPTLLYELFIVSDINGDRPYSLALLEELTELQPFNIDFWNALAQTQSVGDLPDVEPDLDGALNSLEFALAIDNNNAEALSLKASIMLQRGNPAEAVRLLKPMADKMPTAITAHIYVCAELELNHRDMASRLLDRYCPAFPESLDLVKLALALDHPRLVDFLIAHFSTYGDPSEAMHRWVSWIESLYREGNVREASVLLDILHQSDSLEPQGYKLLFSALYVLGEYDRCIALYDRLEKEHPDMLMTEMVIATMMSYVRKGNKAAARKAFRNVSGRFPMALRDNWTIATSIESIGMTHFMTALKSVIEGNGPMNPELIDIFEFPYTQSSETE